MIPFTVTFSNVLLMLLYLLPGFFMCKVRKVKPDHLSSISVILLYIFFMLVPILLLVVPQRFSALITDTPLGGFFYRMNPFVWMIPTT